jgi:hypothetical protein
MIGLFIVFALRAARQPQKFGPPPGLWFVIPIAVWAALIAVVTLMDAGLLPTLIGLRAKLLPIPMIWIGYRAFSHLYQLETITVALMLQFPIIAAITVSQLLAFTSLSGAIGALPAGFGIAGVVRPPGTFSAPGHLGYYLLFSVPLAIGLLGLHSSPFKRFAYISGLLAAIVTLTANTQRATIVLLAFAVPLIAVFTGRARAVRMIAVGAVIVVAGGLLGTWVTGDTLRSRLVTISSDLSKTLMVVPTERLMDALAQPVFGAGFGAASPGTPRLTDSARRRDATVNRGKSAESYYAALVYEMGLPGLVAYIVLLGGLLTRGYRAMRECRSSRTAVLAAAIFTYMLCVGVLSWSYDPLHYPPGRVLFWFWAGVLLSLPRLSFAPAYALKFVPHAGRPLDMHPGVAAIPRNATVARLHAR